MSKVWICKNCGHAHKSTETLEELGFIWLDQDTSKTTCQNCGSYTIQRVYTYDDRGVPIAGYFLLVRPKNKIRKGRK